MKPCRCHIADISIDALSDVVVETAETCSICLEAMKVGDVAKELTCCHQFHAECLLGWWQILGLTNALKITFAAFFFSMSVSPDLTLLFVCLKFNTSMRIERQQKGFQCQQSFLRMNSVFDELLPRTSARHHGPAPTCPLCRCAQPQVVGSHGRN